MDFITLMLIDKSYYDYDFENRQDTRKERLKQLRPKSDAEIQERLKRMGFGNIMANNDRPTLTPDEMQRIAMTESRDKDKH